MQSVHLRKLTNSEIKAEKGEEIIAFVIVIARHISQVETWSSGLTLSQQRPLALFVF